MWWSESKELIVLKKILKELRNMTVAFDQLSDDVAKTFSLIQTLTEEIAVVLATLKSTTTDGQIVPLATKLEAANAAIQKAVDDLAVPAPVPPAPEPTP